MSQENGQHHHDRALRGAGIEPISFRTGLRTQIDTGWYNIHQNDQLVGQVFVEQLADGRTIEHWWLGPAYTSPSGSTELTRDISLRFTFNPPSSSTMGGGLQEVLRSFEQNGGQYVKADCIAQVR